MSDLPVRDLILDGPMYTQSDPGYEVTRIGSGTTPIEDRFPELIVCPENPDDVSKVLAFVQSKAHSVSVRSGGHDVLGASTGAGGVMIDLSKLDRVSVDPASGVAVVGGGVRAAQLVEAASVHGLVPVIGMSGNVGLSGITLGGGMGWTSGSHGAVVDNLLAAKVVTADGQILRVDEHTNPDLFWAMRGGGGNFGVVIEFTYRLRKLASVLAGTILFEADITDSLEFYREFLTTSGDQIDTAMFIVPGKKPVIMFMFCWSGDESAGWHAIRRWRTFAPKAHEEIGTQTFRHFLINNQTAYSRLFGRTGTIQALDNLAIKAFADVGAADAPTDCVILLTHFMHGELCRVQDTATPFIREAGKLTFGVTANWTGDPGPPEKIQWVESSAAALRGIHAQREYINYVSHNANDVVRRAYGPNYERLATIKRHFDPSNIFRGNRNIIP